MKTYLVTGAFHGIGLEITKQLLANADTRVIGIYNTSKDAAAKLAQEYGNRVVVQQCDLSDRQAIAKLCQDIKDFDLDGIINDAALYASNEWEKALDLPVIDKLLQVNFVAPLMLVHNLQKILVDGASIVNIATVDAFTASYDTVAYGASKAALIHLTGSLAALLGKRKIRVNAIAPGWVDSGEKDSIPEEVTALTPLGRAATRADIANLVEFLLSDKATYISGQTIRLDGAMGLVDYTVWAQRQPDY